MDERSSFTRSQRAGLHERQVDQDRTLAAIHQLEAALAEAAPRRERQWRTSVASALAELDEATAQEFQNAEEPDSLLADIKRTQPRLRTRVRGVRAHYRQLRESITAVRGELEEPGDQTDFAEIRQRLAWVLTVLHHVRASESDLIFDAYYEAFNTELGDEPAR